jgi:hypothetical protein
MNRNWKAKWHALGEKDFGFENFYGDSVGLNGRREILNKWPCF